MNAERLLALGEFLKLNSAVNLELTDADALRQLTADALKVARELFECVESGGAKSGDKHQTVKMYDGLFEATGTEAFISKYYDVWRQHSMPESQTGNREPESPTVYETGNHNAKDFAVFEVASRSHPTGNHDAKDFAVFDAWRAGLRTTSPSGLFTNGIAVFGGSVIFLASYDGRKESVAINMRKQESRNREKNQIAMQRWLEKNRDIKISSYQLPHGYDAIGRKL